MNEESPLIIELLDEAGEPARFAHILTFPYEGERYIALEPLEGDAPDDGDEAEIVLLRIKSENGSDSYVTIDNEVLLEEVFDEFLECVEELDDEE